MEMLDKIIQWETEGMNNDDTVSFFQELIDTGMAWTLQGTYGRTARALIEAGYCHPKTLPGKKGGQK